MIKNLPQGWKVVTLGDIFKLQQGKHLAVNDLHDDDMLCMAQME